MRRIPALIALLAVLGFAAGHVVPAYADEGGDKAPGTDTGKKADKGAGENGTKEKPADITGGKVTGDPLYIHLNPLVLPIINANGAEQIVTLVITIEVKDFDAADKIQTHMPLVRDALMQALYGGLGNGDLRDGHMVDVARVKAKATAAVDSVVGADNIRAVLIEDVGQRVL